MFKEIGKFNVLFPLWFLAERRDSLAKSTGPIGVRGQTGFMTLALFTEMKLAEQFIKDDHLENVAIMKIASPHEFMDLLKDSSEGFSHVAFDPQAFDSRVIRSLSSIPLEYVLIKTAEHQQ